jgi:exodeoxyribonuclease V alpha subunit
MQSISDVHLQWAHLMKDQPLKPYFWLVSKKLSEGHICVDPLELREQWNAAGYDPSELVPFSETKLSSNPLVGSAQNLKCPLILHLNKLYLQRYFFYESCILQRIKRFQLEDADRLLHRKNLLQQPENTNFLLSLFPSSVTTTDGVDWQMVAVIQSFLHQFSIITGGPGTGKTTTVARFLALLLHTNPNAIIKLAAPTGKAAARMAESLRHARIPGNDAVQQQLQQLQPSTLHRLLGTQSDSLQFVHHKDHPIPADCVVVDESSMMDAALFAKFLQAIGPQTKVVLLGDKNQLASVEAGSLFGDLCSEAQLVNGFSPFYLQILQDLMPNPPQNSFLLSTELEAHPLSNRVVELRHSHRFSGEEGIGVFSKAILRNDEEIWKSFFSNDLEDIKVDAQQDVQVLTNPSFLPALLQKFAEGYRQFIEEKEVKKALKFLGELRVLCAVKDGPFGVHAINTKIEEYLHSKRLIRRSDFFYANRPVMITKNYYDLQLFNGDIGIVRAEPNGELRVWFERADGELFSVLPAFIPQSETVFAMTIHKSQGSEFHKILTLIPPGDASGLLTRELLYTAVTRARENALILGSEETIKKMIGTTVQRSSGLMRRFINDF